MRIISQQLNLDKPDHRTIIAAVAQDALPTPGERIVIEGQPFVVEAVYRWFEAYSGALGKSEQAVELEVRGDESHGTGIAEPRAPARPPTLSAGAEADVPQDGDPEAFD
jgi:hypothetical protein